MTPPFSAVDWKRWEMVVTVDTIRKKATSAAEAQKLLLPPKNLPPGETYWVGVNWKRKS